MANTVTTFQCICKRAWIPFTSDNDDVIPANPDAIIYELQAMQKRDAEDFVRERDLKNEADQSLADQNANETGPQAQGVISIEDDYFMEAMHGGGDG
jgi:MoxR-like ATPase